MSSPNERRGFAPQTVTARTQRRTPALNWELAAPDGIGLEVAELDFGTAPGVVQALQAAISRAELGYLTSARTAELARACADWQASQHGWNVSPADVRPLPDVVRALQVAIEHFSAQDSPVIVPVPAYPAFLAVPRLLGRQVIQVRFALRDGRASLDLEELDRAFALGGRLLVLCNPHNPLGRVFTEDELNAITEVVALHGGRVFADEVFGPVVYPGHTHVPYAATSAVAAGHTLTAVSASKAWQLAGLKCAQVILGNDEDRQQWARLGRLATDGTSTLGVLAATAAYRGGRTWLASVLGQLDHNRRLLSALLDEHLPFVRYTPPEGTFLAWLDFRDPAVPATGLAAFFTAQARVTALDGASCGYGQGFLRINLGTSPAVLSEAVQRMAHALRSR